jgi:serine-type D-Ala-D-Ala carboxypeptidase/endopeptidase (penicillin-binding protein 4)
MRPRSSLPVALLLCLLFPGMASAGNPLPLPGPDLPAVTPKAGQTASTSANEACSAMRQSARSGNSRAGLRVRNLSSGKTICGLNANGERSLASNTKIFTTSAALARLGKSHRFATRLFADGQISDEGVLKGSLYLKGDGDPSLGTKVFLSSYLAGEGSAIENLANQAKKAGIKRVTGRLWGDDTIFDRLGGVADSGYATSPYIGPLSGLAFNAGFTGSSLSSFSSNPAKLATKTLVRQLRSRGIKIQSQIAMAKTPNKTESMSIAQVTSPTMTWMARVTNLNSNNFFAETLLKGIGAAVRGTGTTKAGASVSERYAAKQGSAIKQTDGSGLTISNRSTAANVVRMLSRVRDRPFGDSFVESLPVAGLDGTLRDRMRGSAAKGRCHAKTGTLTGVSALSGYCFNKSGQKFAFSILMNGVYNLAAAQRGQDRIAALIARL